MSARRGTTLVEISVLMMVTALVLAGADTALDQLRRLSRGDPVAGALAEQACDLLRRDLAAGALQPAETGLVIALPTGAIAWRVIDGRLQRGERQLLAVTRFAIERRDGRVAVALTPVGLPPRRIEVRP